METTLPPSFFDDYLKLFEVDTLDFFLIKMITKNVVKIIYMA